jgi:hypothetical protein
VDAETGYSATSGLNAYGIPYELVAVPQAGITLPVLNSSTTSGNYGGIIVLSEVSYDYSTGYASALTDDQWQDLYDYQTSFGVRMVRLDVYPDSDFGTYCPRQCRMRIVLICGAGVEAQDNGVGCCNTGVEQLVYFTNSSSFPTANLIE